MTKKILLIIGIVVIIGVAVFLMWGSAQPEGEGDSRVGFSVRDFLPFGKSDEPTTDTTPQPPEPIVDNRDQNITNANNPIPRLRKISNEPVAGGVIFNTGTTSVVRFIEKGTGNVYEATSNSAQVRRLSNTTIPKVIRAFWLPNGSGFLAQTILPDTEIIQTSFVRLNKLTATSTETLTPYNTTISSLPTGIKEMVIKPDSAKIFYYTASGSSNWYTSNPDGTAATLVSSEPLSEWLPTKWVGANSIAMQNKSDSSVTSYAYTFDVQTKVLRKTGLGGVGLSSLPNSDLSFTLASAGGNSPQLFLFDNKAVSTTPIKISTLTDKCVWTKEKSPTVYCAIPTDFDSANYPESWYMGAAHTEDFLEKIDIKNEIYSITSNLSQESGEKIDASELMLSGDESHLIFRNKLDGYLWMLRIES